MNTDRVKEHKKRIFGWKRAAVWAAAVLGTAILAAVLAFSVSLRRGQEKLKETGSYFEKAADPMPDAGQLEWNGEQYRYREGLINILFLGIDGRGKAEENPAIGFGAKADCIILVSLDTENDTFTFLNISRDAVTPIRWFDSTGKEIGLYDYQLGLQYTMGEGLETSCEYMEEAVSRMLGGIPIQGFCALYWNGVEKLHEELGPVTVEVPEELHELDPYHFLESGKMELTPEQAKSFVQGRDISQTGSNEARMLRQQEYIRALYKILKEKIIRNPFSVYSMKKTVEEYLVTDLETDEILALAWQARKAMGEDIAMLSVPGVTQATQFQDEFLIDKEALEKIRVSIFYDGAGSGQ